jgi:hypothetical protein
MPKPRRSMNTVRKIMNSGERDTEGLGAELARGRTEAHGLQPVGFAELVILPHGRFIHHHASQQSSGVSRKINANPIRFARALSGQRAIRE